MHEDEFATRQVIDMLLPGCLERLRTVTGLPVVLGGSIRQGGRGTQLILDSLLGTSGNSLRGLVVEPGKGLGGCVVRRRVPLRVNDYTTAMAITHEYDQEVREEGLTSAFAVPVFVRGQVRGVMYGALRDRRAIDDRTVKTAVVVAGQLQGDIESRLHYERGDTAHGARRALADLAAVIRDTSDPGLRARLVGIQRDLTGQSEHIGPKPLLAPREVDVLRLVEVGASNLEIATRLGLRLETVKSYVRSAMRKLEVHNRTAAAHRARLNGLL